MSSDSDCLSDEVPEIGYSRDETVAAMRDLVDFATKMYMDETAYEFPPSTGWPSITPDSMRHLGKTGDAVDLLRHLPYPSNVHPVLRPQLMPALAFYPFPRNLGASTETLRIVTEGIIWKDVPPHVVGLTKRPRNDHGVLVDTKLGVVFWHDAAGEFKLLSPFPTLLGMDEPDDDEDISPGESAWRSCDMVWTVPDFFATLKHHLKELNFVPMSPIRLVDGFYGPDSHGQEAVDMVKVIYRAHGWPDLERYRKEDCLKAIYIAMCENFPDELEDEEWGELLKANA